MAFLARLIGFDRTLAVRELGATTDAGRSDAVERESRMRDYAARETSLRRFQHDVFTEITEAVMSDQRAARRRGVRKLDLLTEAETGHWVTPEATHD